MLPNSEGLLTVYFRRQTGAFQPQITCKRDEYSKAKGYKLRDTMDRVERVKKQKDEVKDEVKEEKNGPPVNMFGVYFYFLQN